MATMHFPAHTFEPAPGTPEECYVCGCPENVNPVMGESHS